MNAQQRAAVRQMVEAIAQQRAAVRQMVEALEKAFKHHSTTSVPLALAHYGSLEAAAREGRTTWCEVVPAALICGRALLSEQPEAPALSDEDEREAFEVPADYDVHRDGPVMRRGTRGDGSPWMGTMRQVLEDYKQAASTEASLGDEARAVLSRGESRKPLTIEQIRDAVFAAGLMFTGPDEMVARAIEKAHGIGEGND